MYESIFNIDFNRLIGLLVPIRRRKPKMLHWLMALNAPVIELYNRFLQYRASTLYKLNYTPQVFSIENVLNDAFDRTQRRIYIEDGEYTFPVYFYDRNDDRPVRFPDRGEDGAVRFYDRSSLLVSDVDFTVILPQGLGLSNAEMIRLNALIDFYKLPDRTHTVTYG